MYTPFILVEDLGGLYTFLSTQQIQIRKRHIQYFSDTVQTIPCRMCLSMLAQTLCLCPDLYETTCGAKETQWMKTEFQDKTNLLDRNSVYFDTIERILLCYWGLMCCYTSCRQVSTHDCMYQSHILYIICLVLLSHSSLDYTKSQYLIHRK